MSCLDTVVFCCVWRPLTYELPFWLPAHCLLGCLLTVFSHYLCSSAYTLSFLSDEDNKLTQWRASCAQSSYITSLQLPVRLLLPHQRCAVLTAALAQATVQRCAWLQIFGRKKQSVWRPVAGRRQRKTVKLKMLSWRQEDCLRQRWACAAGKWPFQIHHWPRLCMRKEGVVFNRT